MASILSGCYKRKPLKPCEVSKAFIFDRHKSRAYGPALGMVEGSCMKVGISGGKE